MEPREHRDFTAHGSTPSKGQVWYTSPLVDILQLVSGSPKTLPGGRTANSTAQRYN